MTLLANSEGCNPRVSFAEKLQTNVWKIINTTELFLAQLQPSEFASKVLCLVP